VVAGIGAVTATAPGEIEYAITHTETGRFIQSFFDQPVIMASHMNFRVRSLESVMYNDESIGISNRTIYFHALLEDGTLWGWGENNAWQLGDGTTIHRNEPVLIMDDVRSFSIIADGEHIQSRNNVHNWWNRTTIYPRSYQGLMISITPHLYSMTVLGIIHRMDGSVWVWGDSVLGQTGPIENRAASRPVKIMEDVDYFTAIGSIFNTARNGPVTSASVMALTTNGTLLAWGDNANGQFGDGSRFYRQNAVEILNYVASFLFNRFGLTAQRMDGSIWEWDSRPKTRGSSTSAESQVVSALRANLVPQSLHFEVMRTITRAEFCALVVMFYEAVTGREIVERVAFTDTNDINVEKAAAIGVVNGVGDNIFLPDDAITQEQVAVMLLRMATAVGHSLPSRNISFDNSLLSEWAIEAAEQTVGIMYGIGLRSRFAAQELFTVEQSIIAVFNLYSNIR